MGQKSSAEEADESYPLLGFDHPFTDRELRRMWKRFKQLDHGKSGDITMDDLLSIYELSLNPMVYRIFTLFCNVSPFSDDTDEAVISFPNFVRTFSVFHRDTVAEEKKKFLFRVFDVSQNGVISASDLFYILKMMLGENISDENLGELVSLVLSEVVGSTNGVIQFPQFADLIDDKEIMDLFSFSF